MEVEPPLTGSGGVRPSFEELYRTHYRGLFRLAMILLGDRPAAEEAVQDSFLTYLARPEGTVVNPVLYIRTAVVNSCRSRMRRRRVASRLHFRPPSTEVSAEERALLNEGQMTIVRALRQLPRRQKECLVLRFYGDMPEGEIAKILGVSHSAVKTHVRRGLATLARMTGEIA